METLCRSHFGIEDDDLLSYQLLAGKELVFDAEEESFELDPDEDAEPWPKEIDDDDDKALAARALTLVRMDHPSMSIGYVDLKAAWDEVWHSWTQSSVCNELPWSTDQDSPRTRKLVEDYDAFDFPTDLSRFGDLEIYVRRE
ncbi:hypothetical protein MBLNU459_g7658t1 [Dothideomycetes sp. NU459]